MNPTEYKRTTRAANALVHKLNEFLSSFDIESREHNQVFNDRVMFPEEETFNCTLQDKNSWKFHIHLKRNQGYIRFKLSVSIGNGDVFSKTLFIQKIETAQEAISLLQNEKLFNQQFIKQVPVITKPNRKKLKKEVYQYLRKHWQNRHLISKDKDQVMGTFRLAEGQLYIIANFPSIEYPILKVVLLSGKCMLEIIEGIRFTSLEEMIKLIETSEEVFSNHLLSFMDPEATDFSQMSNQQLVDYIFKHNKRLADICSKDQINNRIYDDRADLIRLAKSTEHSIKPKLVGDIDNTVNGANKPC
ncbi:hypothetical protein V6R21_07580 [Limibacter armeniacum]|uniref:hypothetical protein n=1 Tax=Limibacter armeniacum TaxID=466084 RepID=UPI002FE619AB